MKIKALLPWYGSKRTLADEIVRQLGPHSSYWEPFCGSMAVLLAKPVAPSETVNDMHRDLMNLALVVRDPRLGAELYRMLRRTLFHEGLYLESLATIRREPPPVGMDVLRAYDYFVASWAGRSGQAGTASTHQGLSGFCKRYSSNGGDSAGRFASAVDSIPAWRRRMRGVTILGQGTDSLELLKKIEDKRGTVIYVDPPYVQKSAKYQHDFTEAQHIRLVHILRQFIMTRVVVSYYDHPKVKAWYKQDRWSWVDCTMTANLRNLSGKPGVAPEILLINGPPADEPPSLFGGQE